MRASLLFGLAVSALALAGAFAAGPPPADTREQAAKPAYREALIPDVPHVRQRPDFCGEACVAMYLRKLGKPELTQDLVFNVSGVDPAQGRGCYARDLVRALEALGFKPGTVSQRIDPKTADAGLEAAWRELHADLEKGVPSVVCMHFSDPPDTTEHFRLVLGYDPKKDEVIYHEPAENDGAYQRMKRELALKLWPLKYDAKRWTVIRIRLEPGRILGPAPAAGFTNADYAQHMMTLKKKIPADGFTVVIEPPFVVIGDEAPVAVRRHALHTVKWAVDKLKQDYFAKDPDEILDVWLFADETSYQKHTKSIFNDRPDTPYGYYSETHHALIMNIGTGGGTLVHEIVHPFMRANFPNHPAWLNEGLGSLYEQCGEIDGHIRGGTNWRLAALQKAIRKGSVPSFETMTGMNDTAFYTEDKGTNYAQARYLCYYLQEKGLLVKFYKEFLRNRKEDPSGLKTLKKVLDEDDMAAFKKRWEAFVLKLTYP